MGSRRALDVAARMDPTAMQLQYLETLKQIGAAPSTKIVLPMELSVLVGRLRGIFEASEVDTTTDRRPPIDSA